MLVVLVGACTLSNVRGAGGTPPGGPSVPAAQQALFQDLPVVEAASLHTQNLEEAPANVTVISAADIRRYGYRTLGEALAGVRGLDVTYDRIYHYVGVHGFSIPGDYNTRFLVMLNGHPLTENVYSSNGFFGQDFGLDMDLVQRIEVVRGPSSALYGSNGMFATINVVTKSPVDQTHVRASTEMGSFGERKGLFSSSMYLGKGANLLVSASVFHNGGQDHYFPQFDSPETNHGLAAGVDSERGYHTFANLVWRDWSFTAYFNNREKQPPMAWDTFSRFSDPGSRTRDSRNFVQASHSRDVGAGKVHWQASYNQYRYDDRFDYDTEAGLEDFRDIARGDWIASLATYDRPLAGIGRLTVGAAANIDLRNLQRNFAVSPAYREQLYVSRPDRLYSLFAQQEWKVARRWTAYVGLRFDASRNYANSLSPRLALVYQRSPQTVYKFVYGRPFRNPSTYEKYYYDNLSFLPSGNLRPEKAHTFEVSAERRLRPGLAAIVNVYHYGLRDLIQAVYVPDTELQQFQNSASNRAAGVEGELSGKVSRRLETAVSFAVQRATNSATGAWLVNSPRQIGKARALVPLFREKLCLSGSFQYLSARQTRAGDNLPAVILTDFTATTNRLHREFDLQLGVRNLFDRRYWDPVALAVDRMPQDGRSAFVKLIWRPAE